MARVALFILTGLLIFALSAGGSWYMQQQGKADDAETADRASPEDQGELKADSAELPEVPDEPMQIVANPDATPEEIMQLFIQLRERNKNLDSRKNRLDRRQAELDLILKDIQGEQLRIQGLRDSAVSQGDALVKLRDEVEAKLQELFSEQAEAERKLSEFKASTVEYNQEQLAKNRGIASILEYMEPDSAAVIVKNLVNTGKLSDAVAVLTQMEERKVGELIESISRDDKDLATQLINHWNGVTGQVTGEDSP